MTAMKHWVVLMRSYQTIGGKWAFLTDVPFLLLLAAHTALVDEGAGAHHTALRHLAVCVSHWTLVFCWSLCLLTVCVPQRTNSLRWSLITGRLGLSHSNVLHLISPRKFEAKFLSLSPSQQHEIEEHDRLRPFLFHFIEHCNSFPTILHNYELWLIQSSQTLSCR